MSPVVGLGQTGGGVGPGLGLVPHQGLQLPELVPQVGVAGGNGLSDAGVEVGHPCLGCGAEVRISCMETLSLEVAMSVTCAGVLPLRALT